MKKIDFNKGIKQETMPVDEFNARYTGMPVDIVGVNYVTVYSFDDVQPKNYCKKHQGSVIVDGVVYEWIEDCDCV